MMRILDDAAQNSLTPHASLNFQVKRMITFSLHSRVNGQKLSLEQLFMMREKQLLI